MIDAILGRSQEESEIMGDGLFLEYHEGAEQHLHKLPRCENDNDYPLLLKRLCDDDLLPTGPYGPRKKAAISRVTEQLSSAFLDDNVRAYA